MSRSVSVPCSANYVVFAALSDDMDHDDFTDLIANLQGEFRYRLKSFQEADKWIGREDHVILEGPRGMIGISEYCGLAAVWLIANGSKLPDRKRFAGVVGNCVGHDNLLRKLGTFSNGESMYERVNA